MGTLKLKRWGAAAVVPAVVALLGCPTDNEPVALVSFVIDAPTCSWFTYEFSIDGAERDTLMLNHADSSAVYETTPGSHTLSARIVTGFGTNGDTTVTLAEGQHFVRSVYVYCS